MNIKYLTSGSLRCHSPLMSGHSLGSLESQLVEKCPALMDPKDSLPFSQKPNTEFFFPELDELIPYAHTPFL
jgi:hypothetical protein